MEEIIGKIMEIIEAKRKRELEEHWREMMEDYAICEEATKYLIS